MKKYHLTQRIIHWLMAVFILFLLVLGFVMTNFQLENKYFYYNLHKSFGVILLFLIILRVMLRLKFKAPKLPFKVHKLEKKLKQMTFLSLYLLMFLVPLSGWLMSNSHGYGVKLFQLKMPNLMAKNEFIANISSYTHQYLAYIIAFIVLFHIIAAFKHVFYDGKNIIKRIW